MSKPEQMELPGMARKPDPIWDTVEALFFPSGVPKSQRTRIGKVVVDFKSLSNATPNEIVARYNRAKLRWANITFRPEALVLHWDDFKAVRDHAPVVKAETMADSEWRHQQARRRLFAAKENQVPDLARDLYPDQYDGLSDDEILARWRAWKEKGGE